MIIVNSFVNEKMKVVNYTFAHFCLGRLARSISVGTRLLTSTGEHLPSRLALHHSLGSSRLGSPSHFDGEIDAKVILHL